MGLVSSTLSCLYADILLLCIFVHLFPLFVVDVVVVVGEFV